MTALRSELEPVGDEVVENLRKPRRICQQRRHVLDLCRKLDLASLRHRPESLDSFADDLSEIDFLELDGDLAGVDLGKEEKVSHEVEQAARVPVDDAEESLLLCSELRTFLEEELDVPANRGERGAELVRDERDELILHAVELAQALVLLGQKPLNGLRLGAGAAFSLEQPLPLEGVLVQAAVSQGKLAGDAAKDRKERQIEDEQCDGEDQCELVGPRIDGDDRGAVVLIELERPDRLRRGGRANGD